MGGGFRLRVRTGDVTARLRAGDIERAMLHGLAQVIRLCHPYANKCDGHANRRAVGSGRERSCWLSRFGASAERRRSRSDGSSTGFPPIVGIVDCGDQSGEAEWREEIAVLVDSS